MDSSLLTFENFLKEALATKIDDSAMLVRRNKHASGYLPDWSQDIYVRECYATLAADIATRRNTLVLGSPGVGKSQFGIYLLWLFVSKGKSVAFTTGDGIYCYKGGKIFNDTCALVDLEVVEAGELSTKLRVAAAATHRVVLASPQAWCSKLVKGWLRSAVEDVARRCIPPWSKTELNVLLQDLSATEKAEAITRRRFWGGIPRLVLRVGMEELQQQILTQLTVEQLRATIKSAGVGFSAEDAVDSLVIMHADARCIHTHIAFASVELADQVAQRFTTELIDSGRDLLVASEGDIKGRLLERYVLRCLSSYNHTYKATPLPSSKKQPAYDALTVSLGAPLGPFTRPVGLLQPDKFYVPKSKNYPAVDAFIIKGNELWCFNATISSSHAVSGEGLDKLMQVLPEPPAKIKFFWLVHDDSEMTTAQPIHPVVAYEGKYQNMKQFRVKFNLVGVPRAREKSEEEIEESSGAKEGPL
eukprot:TRINITY_DN94252_c0_g1_i1.p1 TRINITY_DN94252_c0_g1~~TRINITY_DN94252_c0_g1_i1.p1  ORF type:complete len:473 (-),score=68.89 TRINITY_DN94252_c0_g1_i1:127-1545(-)